MEPAAPFTLSPDSRILTPEMPGLDVVVDALRAGRSLETRAAAEPAVVLRDGAPQRLYCQTAGSTGRAKTIRRSPHSWIASFEVNRQSFGLGPGDVYAILGPLGHSLAFYAVLEALHIGADLAGLAGIAPKRQVQQLQDLGATVLYATPTQLRLIVLGAEAAGVPALPVVRRVFCGGGRLEPALRARIADVFPAAEFREFFGAAETSFIAMSDAETPEGSVGRAYPGVTLDIRDAGPDGTGEIWVESPYLFDGYVPMDAPGARRDGTYVSIAEMGYLDAEGHLFLRGRKDRMVTVADINVYPEEIEEIAMQAAGLRLCVVLPKPDAQRGHRMVCLVEGAAEDGLDRVIRQACREGIGTQAVPQDIVFMDKIPLLPSGKPDLQRLAQRVGLPA